MPLKRALRRQKTASPMEKQKFWTKLQQELNAGTPADRGRGCWDTACTVYEQIPQLDAESPMRGACGRSGGAAECSSFEAKFRSGTLRSQWLPVTKQQQKVEMSWRKKSYCYGSAQARSRNLGEAKNGALAHGLASIIKCLSKLAAAHCENRTWSKSLKQAEKCRSRNFRLKEIAVNPAHLENFGGRNRWQEGKAKLNKEQRQSLLQRKR